MRRGLVAALILSCGLASCQRQPVATTFRWTALPTSALPTRSGATPSAFSVNAGGLGRPWVIGGVVPAPTTYRGTYFPTSQPSVSVWSARDKRGPWTLDDLVADRQRDGPNETIHYTATAAAHPVVFGWRNSPTEGYPRPSVWYASNAAATQWTEVIEPREFFGGPNIIGFGGLASGVHGEFVAGTWTGPTGSAEAAVWESRDSHSWTQIVLGNGDSSRVELPFATGVSDGPGGVLLIATAETPTRADPLAREGMAWFSADGRSWHRILQGVIAAKWEDSTFDSVTASQDGWIIGGTTSTATGTTAMAWYVSEDGLRVTALPLATFRPGSRCSVSSTTADLTSVIAAAVVDGQVRLWSSSLRNGPPKKWTSVRPPASTSSGAQFVQVSISTSGVLLVVQTKLGSRIWTA